MAKRQKTDEPTPTICVLGATGVGKGSTLNSCFDTNKFSTSARFASDTIKPVSFVLPWRGTGEDVRGVDLCGFSDSEGRDSGFIESMVAYLREEVRHVNCFLLLLNSQEARLGMHLRDMLTALKAIFGTSFMEHVVVGFTRWDYSKKGQILRRGVTQESLSKSVNGLLREQVGHTHDCACIFLDNTLSMLSEDELRALYTCPSCQHCSDEYGLVTSAFHEALEAVRLAATRNAPFICAQLESTLAERDVGRDQIERENAAVDEGEAAYARLSEEWVELGIDEPQSLESSLEAGARAVRERLHQFLSAKCRPDLEHVSSAVLEKFDAKVREATHRLLAKNRMAASSSSRALRMRLTREYKGFIDEVQSAEDATPPSQRFAAIRERFREVLVTFVAQCEGGWLAWQPFVVLQDHLRMEQVDAREKIFRDVLVAGGDLPELSAPAKDPTALIVLLGPGTTVPDWLQRMSGGRQQVATSSGAAIG